MGLNGTLVEAIQCMSQVRILASTSVPFIVDPRRCKMPSLALKKLRRNRLQVQYSARHARACKPERGDGGRQLTQPASRPGFNIN